MLLKIRLKGREIRLSEPICDPTGNAQFPRANLEQLLDQGVDRVLIAAAGSGFVECVDKERRTCRNIRREKECTRLEALPTACAGDLLEQMRFSRAGVAEKN